MKLRCQCNIQNTQIVQDKVEELKSRLEKLKRRMDNLNEMRMDGEISKDEFKELKEKVTSTFAS